MRVPPVTTFYWKLLKIGIQSAKAIRKDVLLLLHPHHQQHTEASGKRLFKAVYPEYTYRIWSLGYYLLRDPLLMSTLINAMFWHGSPKKIGKKHQYFWVSQYNSQPQLCLKVTEWSKWGVKS